MAFPSAPDDYAIFFNHIRGEGAGWLPSRMVSCPSLLNITPLSEQRYHGGVFFNPRIRWIIGRRILGFGAGILGFGAGILGFRQSQDSMCSPLTNPRIRKSQDSPASNPRIFRILGFDVTDRRQKSITSIYNSTERDRGTSIRSENKIRTHGGS